VNPRKEQLIRAKAFHENHLVDYIPWNNLSPDILCQKVLTLLASPDSFKEAISRFRLTGIETMGRRLQAFRCGLE
jgi:predicted glycosyltransferase